ncbi:MAG: CAP domain-containing protein [Acidobacteriota bacterium]
MLSLRRVRFFFGCVCLVLVSACAQRGPTAPSGPDGAGSLAITAQPQSQTIAPGTRATLTVSAAGADGIAYQWYVGGAGDTSAPIAGAIGAAYATLELSATARYWVRVTAAGRTVDSVTATITVDAAAPTITRQPKDESIVSGQTARIGVEASGSGTLTYQWFQGAAGSTSSPLEGATDPKFTTPALTEGARYWVRVSNLVGSVDSTTSTISVTAAPAPGPTPTPPPTPPAPPAPPPVPAPADPSAGAFEDDVLVRVNLRRGAGATCGGTAYPPVAPLSMNGNLRSAARAHSLDMATNNYFSHTSLDGRSFLDRMYAAGYTGSGPYAENIAAGYSSAAAAVDGWMSSTGHCTAIMNGSFRVAGVGYAYGAGSSYGFYWTLDFGGS